MTARANTDMPDAEALVRRVASGELSALAPLYERFRPMVLAVIRQTDVSLASAAAEDLCHEVFLALPSAAKRFRAGGDVRTWLAGVAVRKMKEHRRNTWLRRGLLERFFPKRASEPEVEARIAAAQEGRRLLEALPEPLREVLVLQVVEGFSAKQIAEALDISENTVWTRIHRARALLDDVAERE